MKRIKNITLWIGGGVVLLAACLIGLFFLTDILTPEFKETKIYPDENRTEVQDTIFIANGVEIKMIGVKGGKIQCRGLKKAIELDNFYVGETEVTQELWEAIMDENPSLDRSGESLPVENIDLKDCVTLVNRLDSVTGYFLIFCHILNGFM